MMQFKNLTYSLLAFVLVIFTASSLTAQDGNPRREVGIQFSSLDFDGSRSFSAFFKKQKKENVYRRIRFFSGSLSARSFEDTFIFDFSAGIAIGREKRKSLDPKLEFYQGPEFSIRLGLATEDNVRVSIAPAFGWVLGLQHSFNNRWAVNLETIPSLSITANINNGIRPDVLLFGAGFNNSVSLGLVRKF